MTNNAPSNGKTSTTASFDVFLQHRGSKSTGGVAGVDDVNNLGGRAARALRLQPVEVRLEGGGVARPQADRLGAA